MAKDFAKAFYNSQKWKRCRASYIQDRVLIDGGMCETCKEELGFIVHHTIVLTAENIDNPEISLNKRYLKYDCKKCHDREEVHPFVKTSNSKCFFDESGQPIPKTERT